MPKPAKPKPGQPGSGQPGSAKSVPAKTSPTLPFPSPQAAGPRGIFAGTSGWAYPTWKPGFYPAGVSTKNFLPYYASRLTSVEVNYTFRELPTPGILAAWLASAPTGFRLSFKAPQRITHFSRLRDTGELVAEFVNAIQPAAAEGKLGLLLFQLPPNFKADAALLENFLAAPAFRGNPAPRIAFEFRHESWFKDDIYTTLRRHNAALCIADGDDLATPEVHTADSFTSFRLRRSGGYKPKELAAFAAKMTALVQSGREVYTYFRHEDEPTGALNALAFLKQAAKLEGPR